MRSKAVIVFVTLLAITLLAGSAFAQIQWGTTKAAELSVLTPGKITACTLDVVLDTNAELTYNQTLTLWIGDFIVASETIAETENNYVFSSTNGALNMDNDGSDFTVTYSETDSTLTFTLGEFALVPGDDLKLVVSNVLINKGDNGSATDAFHFKIKSSDQPLWSTDTDSDNDLSAASDQRIKTITFGDSVAGNQTYAVLVDSAEGYIPKTGKLKVILPDGYTFTSSSPDSVFVWDDGAAVTLDYTNITATTRTLEIPFNNSADIADGSLLTINIGNSGNKIINNPAIYSGTAPDTTQQRTFTTGIDPTQALTATANKYNVTVYGLDYDDDEIFLDQSAAYSGGAIVDLTYEVVSNWFPVATANTGWGGTLIGDNTAGSLTQLDIWFMTSTNVDSVNWIQFDLSAFDVDYSQAIDSTNFAFSGGGNLTAGTFHTDTVSGSPTTIRITPQLGQGVALPPHTQIKLTITSGVLQNKGAATDFTVSMNTADQTTSVSDRDTDEILPNTGGIINGFWLQDSAAGQPSAIDTLRFVTAGWIPADGKIKITMPSQFVLQSAIDSAVIWFDSAGTSWPNGKSAYYLSTGLEPDPGSGSRSARIKAISTDSSTITNTEIILELADVTNGHKIPAGSNVWISVGDTLGYHSGAATYDPAFNNPAPTYAGQYPTTGSRSPISITVYNSSGGELLTGNNSTAPIGINTIKWGAQGEYMGSGLPKVSRDSMAYFGSSGEVDHNQSSVSAGDSLGLRIWFTVGDSMWAGDTLYIGIGNYFQVDTVEAEVQANVTLAGGGFNGGAADQYTLFYSTPKNALALILAGDDQFEPDSLITLTFEQQGTDGVREGGVLFAQGQRSSDILLSLWSSRQHTAVTMDTTHLSFAVAAKDTVAPFLFAKEDSVAGNTSSDSLYIEFNDATVFPGGYITVKLDSGMSFVTTANGWDGTKLTVDRKWGPAGTETSSLTPTVTRVSNDSIKIAFASDTLGNGRILQDTLVIKFGDGTTDLINNYIPDSISGRRDAVILDDSPYIIRIFDSSDRLVKDYAYGGAITGTGATVTNVFNGGPLSTKGKWGVAVDTAGASIDTMYIPFSVGAPVTTGDALQLTFHGAIYTSSTAAETESNYEFYGDTSGVTGGFAFTTSASNDSVLTFTFTAGTLGTGNHAQPFKDTLMIINNVMSFLGYDSTNTNFTDGLSIDLVTTGVQTTSVTDTTTKILYDGGTRAQNLATGLWTEGLSSLLPGASSVTWIGGYGSGADYFHGTLFKDGIIRLKFPVSQDSLATHGTTGQGVYAYSFPDFTDPGSGTGDNTLANSGNVGTSNFTIIGRAAGAGQPLDTLTVGWVTYDTVNAPASGGTTYHDTAIFTIKMNDASGSVGSHDTLIVQFSGRITNPTEASSGSQLAASPFRTELATSAMYGVVMEIADRRGIKISQGTSLAAWNDIDAGGATNESQFLVLMEGQTHDPGGINSGGSVGAPTTIAATDDSTHFMIATVDDYYNIIDAATAENVDITVNVYSGGDVDNTSEAYIGDELSTTGNLRIDNAANGVVMFTTGDSVRIHKAGDGNTDLGRNFHKTIQASLAAARTTNVSTQASDKFSVTHGTYTRLAVLAPGETLLEGDTTSVKSSNPDPVELSEGGTYDITVYPTDIYYNRSDTIHVGSPTGHLTIAGTNVTPVVTTDGFEASGTNKYSAVFQIKADLGATAADGAIVTVTETAVTISQPGQTTFTVVTSTVSAVFAALADSTEPAGATFSFSVDLKYSGSFPSNEGWTFWVSSDSGSPAMNDAAFGGTKVIENIHTGENTTTAATFAGVCTLKTINLEGTYYIYATIPSIDSLTIGQSEGFWLQHQPIVDTVTTAITPNSSGTVLNSGSSPATTTQAISFSVKDYNDSDVPVWIFLNTDGDGVKTDFAIGDTSFTVDGTASIKVSPTSASTALDKFDITYTMDILAPQGGGDYIEAGDYYVYVVTKDPSGDVNTARSAEYLTIKHSPSITLDKPVLGVTEINTKDTRSLTIGWTSGGDVDIDDNATIKLFLADTSKNWDDSTTAVGVDSVLNGGTSIDVTGSTTISENDDGGINDLYTWDLTSSTTANLPVDGTYYDVYALIYDDRDTVLAKSPGAVMFTHDPVVKFDFNFGNAITKSAGLSKASAVTQLTVNNGEILRVGYDGTDLDQDQYIRFVVSQRDTTGVNYGSFTFGTDGWIMNSTNGLESGAQAVTTDESYFNWFSENMGGLTGTAMNGDYFVYAFITKDGTNANWINANVSKYVARGKVKLTGREASVTDWDLRVSPSLVSVTEGDTVECTLLLDSQGEELEVFAAYIDIDTSLFTVIDIDSPFVHYGSNYFFGGQTAIENTGSLTAGDSLYKLNLVKQKTSGGTATDSAVATFKLIARGNSLAGTKTGNVYFASEAGRYSKSIHNGVDKGLATPSPAIRVNNNPAATILGLVPLEKRTNHSKVITFELRKLGEEVPYLPTSFVNANDEDGTTSGVQITTASDGQYTLTNIPTGRYYLVAKAESYITGKYPLIDVVAGDALQGIHPTYNNDADPIDYGELKGGDVSSTSTPGTGDNLINTADISYITTNWGATGVNIGDIDGDGSIGFSDFSIASANQGLKGIPPRYNKISISNEDVEIKLEGVPEMVQPGEEFTVEVWAKNVSDLFAYVYQVRFDSEKLEFVNQGVEEGDMLPSRPGASQTFFFTKQQDKGTLVASALSGRSDDKVSGSGVIARMTFRALSSDGTPDIQLHNVRLANSNADVDRLGDVALLPDEFGLADNYPNPFNPVTKIRFQLPQSSHVTMKIYNILGQEVATLVNRDMSAGFHFVRWNGTNSLGKRVASGIYIYRIEAGNFKMSKKMTLIK